MGRSDDLGLGAQKVARIKRNGDHAAQQRKSLKRRLSASCRFFAEVSFFHSFRQSFFVCVGVGVCVCVSEGKSMNVVHTKSMTLF